MPFILPVPGPAPDTEGLTAQQWEQAVGGPGPSTAGYYDGPQVPRGGDVTKTRTGPGDVSGISDQWMGVDLAVIGRQGVENGRQLFDQNQWQPPNEGHGEYGFAQDGPKIDHSVVNFALFWSDWNASTALQAGGRGSFTGEHVVINRVAPGSAQGYMPSDPGMVQANNVRNMPTPWDAAMVVGGQ